jgi:hypothetical protein
VTLLSKIRTGLLPWFIAALTLAGLVALLLWVMEGARAMAWVDACMTNQTKFVQAASMYADANDDRLPIADRWMDEMVSTWPNGGSPLRLRCPALQPGEYGYAMNQALSTQRWSEIDDDTTPIFFETDVRYRNAFGGPDLLLAKGRHGPLDSGRN